MKFQILKTKNNFATILKSEGFITSRQVLQGKTKRIKEEQKWKSLILDQDSMSCKYTQSALIFKF